MKAFAEKTKKKRGPTIDYDNLRAINCIDGLSDHIRTKSSPEAHQEFMENYHRMFIQPPKATFSRMLQSNEKNGKSSTKAIASFSGRSMKPDEKSKKCVESNQKEISHNIGDYLPQLRKEKKEITDEAATQEGRIRLLRRLLRKRPFMRTAADNKLICRALKEIPALTTQVDAAMLSELSVTACLETEEESMTVFGNTGFHVLLKGSAVPQSFPFIRSVNESEERFKENTEDVVFPTLHVGDCFGTLKKLESIKPNSTILTVITNEPCEFVKLFTGDFARISRQIGTRTQAEKIALLTSNEEYKGWSENVLLKVGTAMKWQNFAPNTVLASEGFRAPFIGFLRKGECVVLRQVHARKALANGKVERRSCQVVIGRLKVADSFGEISILDDVPMTCTVVTETPLEIGVIEENSLNALDDDTRKLIRQSSKPTFGKVTQKECEEEYIRQESRREWNEFKHNIVMDVINGRGMRPGYGKWSK